MNINSKTTTECHNCSCGCEKGACTCKERNCQCGCIKPAGK
jgi:hypothetical protein